MDSLPSSDLISRFAAIVGEAHVVTDEKEMAPRLSENRGLYHGRAAMVLKPASTEEVSRIMALASETGTPVVPQTGNTGLVGGQTPSEDGKAIILSLERMSRIRDIDPLAM